MNTFLILLSNGVNSPLNFFFSKSLTYVNWFEFIDSPTNIEVIGQLIYTNQMYFFILSGLVLLVAVVGAISVNIASER